MILKLLLGRQETLTFDRTYAAPPERVWAAWTDAELLRRWWGPEKTVVTDCEVDPEVGGRVYVVMEATEEMGRYAGTRWPTEGTFTHVEAPVRLTYDGRSWTEGEQDTTTIEHVTDLRLTPTDGGTLLELRIAIDEIGSGAKLAAFGMRWGYKAYLDALGELLEG